MNRTIKFRAWDKRTSRFYLWEDDRFGVAEYIGDCPEYITLNQFTGLLDKNGKEIYEGDIISLVNKNNSLHDCKHINCPHIHDKHPHMSGTGIVGWNDKKASFNWWRVDNYKDREWYKPIGIFDKWWDK